MLHCATAMSTTNIPPGSRARLHVLACIALALATGCSDGPGQSAPGAADPTAAGARVYAMACARCHAADGAGDGQMTGRLGPIPPLKSPAVAALSTADLEALIRNGRGAMPPHDKRLAPEQIRAVAGHVRQLNGHP